MRLIASPKTDRQPRANQSGILAEMMRRFLSCEVDIASLGTMASTGKRRHISTSLAVCIDLSKAAMRYMIPKPKTRPAAAPPAAKCVRLGKEGLLGKLG